MCKTDEIFLVRFDFDMKLLYGRHHNKPFLLRKIYSFL